jgi:hypothetical protein
VNTSLTVLLLIGMIAFSSMYVVTWAMNISAALIREHEHHTYDLLCLSPPGALATNWAICTGVLHRDDALGWLDLLRKLMAGLLLFILLAVLLTTAWRQNTADPFQFFLLALDMVTLAAASYIDHVQSVVLGSLVGMLTPIYSHSRLDAHLITAATFLALQTATLLVTLLVAIVILPGLNFSPPGLTLLVFYLTRETFIVGLWRLLSYHLNADRVAFSL